MCLCGTPGCYLTGQRNHFCTVCGKPCYTPLEAEDHCWVDITPDD